MLFSCNIKILAKHKTLSSSNKKREREIDKDDSPVFLSTRRRRGTIQKSTTRQ